MSQLTHHQEMAIRSPLFNYHFQMLQLIKSGVFLLIDMSRICKSSVEKVSPLLAMAVKVKTILELILIQSLEDQCKCLNSTLQHQSLITCQLFVYNSRMSNPPTGSNVNADEVISQLNDKSDNTVNVEVTRRISDNDQVVQCLTVRVTKWKMVKPFCRFNTVVLVIFLFLSIATAIFILFYKYVLQKVHV